MNTLEDALKPLVGHAVFVSVPLHNSTGRGGKVVSVGSDHLVLKEGNSTFIIPYSAVSIVQPQS